jgi:hypothetical protein
MTNRFDYLKFDEQSIAAQEGFKAMHNELATHIEAMGPGRAQAVALTKLEECYMWVGKALRDMQVMRSAPAKPK